MEPQQAAIALVASGIPLYPKFAISNDTKDIELVFAKHELKPINSKAIRLSLDFISGLTTVRYCERTFNQDLYIIDEKKMLTVDNIILQTVVKELIPAVPKYKRITTSSKIFIYNPKFLDDYKINPTVAKPSSPLYAFKNLINKSKLYLYPKPKKSLELFIRTNKWNSMFLIFKNISLYEGILFEVVNKNHRIKI
jgi:hypothetical protein